MKMMVLTLGFGSSGSLGSLGCAFAGGLYETMSGLGAGGGLDCAAVATASTLGWTGVGALAAGALAAGASAAAGRALGELRNKRPPRRAAKARATAARLSVTKLMDARLPPLGVRRDAWPL